MGLTMTDEEPRIEIDVEDDLLVIRYIGTFTHADLERELPRVAEVVRRPDARWLSLSDFSALRVGDRGGEKLFVEFSKANRPFVERSAVVGLGGLKRLIFDLVVRFSGRGDSLRRFEDADEALAWLRGAD